MLVDFSNDWTTWDNVEPVSFESRRNAGPILGYIPVSKRHALTTSEVIASGGAYQKGDVSFYLPDVLIPPDNYPPKPGDAVIDRDQVRYISLLADARRRDANGKPSDWKLTCRNLAIAYDLRDLITIQTPTRTLDATKAKRVSEWDGKYQNLPARVQLITEEVAEVLGKRELVGQFEIYVDRELLVSSEDRIVWTRGRTQFPMNALTDPDPSKQPPPFTGVVILSVTGYRAAQRIDELPVVLAGTVA